MRSLMLEYLASFTPGFWTIHRDIRADEDIAWNLFSKGADLSSLLYLARNASIATHKRLAWSSALESILLKIATDFPTTTILFRAIHQYKNGEDYQRIANFDQFTRKVVEDLMLKSVERNKMVGHVQRKVKGWIGREGGEDQEIDLGSRIVLDDWARLMNGQENHYIPGDGVHPNVRPGHRLYANGLLDKLRRVMEEKHRARE